MQTILQRILSKRTKLSSTSSQILKLSSPLISQGKRPNPGLALSLTQLLENLIQTAFTAEALRQQYNSVFSKPRPEWTVTVAADNLSCTGEEGDTILDDFVFTPDDIEQACSELKNSASAGPDGVLSS